MTWDSALPQGNCARETPNVPLHRRQPWTPHPSRTPCSAVPDGVGQGQDPQHKEIHGKQEIDVLLREYLQDKARQ